MERDTFNELLSKGKLFDIDENVLRLHPRCNQPHMMDSFFKALSLGIYGTEQFCIQLRASCVLRFIMLMFNVTLECQSVKQFLENYSESCRLRKNCYTDVAIQMWVYRKNVHTTCKDAKRYFQKDRDGMRRAALEFVRLNNQIGYVSCRFVFSYLISGLHNVSIHLFDDVKGTVYIQPEIFQKAIQKYCGPEMNNSQPKTHIYLWYTNNNFKLLVPQISRKQVTRAQHLLSQMDDTKREKYQLRLSQNHSTNIPVCILAPYKDTDIHYCNLSSEDIAVDGIYQIYPAPDLYFQLCFGPTEKLYVYVVREAPMDVMPYLENIVILEHDITYPYFMLSHDVTKLIVLTSELSKDKVTEYITKVFHVSEQR